jgi:deoxyribonuclease V
MVEELTNRALSLIENPSEFSRREAEGLQLALAAEVRIGPLAQPVSSVCAVDCAYSRDGSRIYVAAVLLRAKDLFVLATSYAVRDCPFPYVPGLLALREGAASLRAICSLPSQPDLALCDGHGIAHPRGLGLASLIGLLTGIPTIGVAKGKLSGNFEVPGPLRGDCSPLEAVPAGSMKRLGTVLRTQDCKKPVFVSPGHNISHEEAVQWVLRLAERSRQPEPLRLAHHAACSLRDHGAFAAHPPEYVDSRRPS